MSEPHERLSEAMNHRRLDLRMNWREVSTAAGISYEALRSIRRGDYRPSEITARALDEALRWAPGSVELVLAGGDPIPLPELRKNQELIAASHADLDAIEAELDRRLRRARREPEQMAAVVETLREIQGEEDSP